MKILFISSRFPYPALKGDQVVLFNRLKHLSKKHEVTLLTFYQNDKELKYLEQVKQFCVRLETVKLPQYESALNLLFFGLFSLLPLQTIYFRSEKFASKLRELLKAEEFDLVHTYLMRMAEYSRHIVNPKVLELIDCMQLNLEKRLAFIRHPQKKFYEEELKRIIGYERKVIREHDASTVVSDADNDYLHLDNTVTIPLGIDTERYCRNAPPENNKTIIFSGNMSYYPNESAIVWFLDNCFTAVRQSVPDVKLKIVGINPGSNIRRYHDGHAIFVTGFVESIVDEMTTAQIAIAPMQSGYGMHIKILEAMSCGLPVVTTSSGKGTIAAEHGTHLWVADNEKNFTDACITLLENRKSAEAIGQNARDLIVGKYSWESSIARLEQTYEEIVRKRKESQR